MEFHNTVASTISRYEVTCAVCSSTITPGDQIFCFEPPTDTLPVNRRPTLAWGHISCHDASLPPPPQCRHWKRLGRCPTLEAGMCAFRHDNAERGTSTSLEKTRWGGKRHYTRNQHKNSVFRTFLMQTYGMEYLTQSNGVIIDVAGGKGELAWELLNLTGVNDCVVIDPRPLNLELVQTKWKKGLFEPKRTGPVFSKWYPACEDGCRLREPKNPSHIRMFFESKALRDFLDASNKNDTWNELNANVRDQWLKEGISRAKRIVWTTKGLQHEDGSSFNEDTAIIPNDAASDDASRCSVPDGAISANSYDTDIESPSQVREILQTSKLIIGFHPDQAAGEIVEFATSRKIPWCIVPCCVYSDCFTKRKLKDGTHVKTYDQLVEWLSEKAPCSLTATLDIEGKNRVVYTLPGKQ